MSNDGKSSELPSGRFASCELHYLLEHYMALGLGLDVTRQSATDCDTVKALGTFEL